MHDHTADGVSGARAVREATRDPGIEVLARVAPVGFQRDKAESHIRHAYGFRKNPGVATGRDGIAEMEIDRVRIELDALEHVMGDGLHVERRHTRYESRPPPH